MHTPKKRYYASKQIFRFVPPGFIRCGVHGDSPDVRLLAFTDTDHAALTITGMNDSERPARCNIRLKGLDGVSQVRYYRTSETENCHLIDNITTRGANWPFTGIDVTVPPASIFTLTSL